jgi:hypothetical protein
MKTGLALLSAGVAALGVTLAAAPASALSYHVTSAYGGGYTVSYDPADQSEPITELQTGYEGVFAHIAGGYVGLPENDGTANGITATRFITHLKLKFVADPGAIFTALEIDDAPLGFHHGYFGGELFDHVTTVTPLGGGAAVTFTQRLENFPPYGTGGGGAYNSGIVLGKLNPPPSRGFVVDTLQSVLLFDDSTWGLGRIDFYVAAIAAPPVTGVPEPAAWALMILGFGGVGAALRRRRLAAA